jgi:hypothetical protein
MLATYENLRYKRGNEKPKIQCNDQAQNGQRDRQCHDQTKNGQTDNDLQNTAQIEQCETHQWY